MSSLVHGVCLMRIGIASNDYRPADAASGSPDSWGGAGWVRVGQWLDFWRERHDVAVGDMWAAGDHVEIELADGTRVAPDVVYLQGVKADVAGLLAAARQSGQRIVFDVDDWLWGLPSEHVASRINADKLAAYTANLSTVDVITTSTPYLASRLAERFSAEIVVIPNYIDTKRFTPVDQDVSRPTIGWAGAVEYRAGDLAELNGVLGQLRPFADFQHSGHQDSVASFADRVGLPADAVRLRGRTDPREWPSALDFQIGLVPLRSTPFNEAKSDLKGLEYAAAGIPFVASPSSSYQQLRCTWGNSVQLARKPVEWLKALRRLLDPVTRRDAASALRERAAERDLVHGAHHHLDLFGALA